MLDDRDKQIIKDHIDQGKPLPPKYKLELFADSPSTELIWPGKTTEVETVVLPFQSIEQIDEPREEINQELSLFEAAPSGRQSGGWTNKLIWGDNRLILSSLANGPMRREIEDAGGLKLVYIDPPFDVGADFSLDIEIGDEEVTKSPSVIEEHAYRDTWGAGQDSFVAMITERLVLIRRLLADDGSVLVHCDWRTAGHLRLVLDEIFGSDRILNEIIWTYGLGGSSATYYPRKHDTIFWYTKSDVWRFEPPLVPATSQRMKGELKKAPDVWDIPSINNMAQERTGFPTQKPEELLARVVSAHSRPGDLVADFFCGSGTTMAVAEKLGRKWIGCDLGRFAIHTTRKRLIGVQRELKAEGKPYRSFEILNLGKYEREYFVGVNPNLPEEQRIQESIAREDTYLDLICQAYSAERTEQIPPFHASKAGVGVVIGPVDAPVSRTLVDEAVSAAAASGMSRVDVLGFEFEMGLTPAIKDEAKQVGVELALKYIPNDVFDKRAIAKGDVRFYDVAYVEAKPNVDGLSASIELIDFGVFYRQQDLDQVVGSLKRKNQSKVIIDKGQIVKITKTGADTHRREVLTENWSDWIDYWAVDFDFESQKELITVTDDDGDRTVWTGRYVFENEWQSYRTRKDRKLDLTSGAHAYEKAGKYRVAVKVIDIFGIDTTRLVNVEVK